MPVAQAAEMFDYTLEVMAKARTIRAAVLDELAER
jgi:hypothetical protein